MEKGMEYFIDIMWEEAAHDILDAIHEEDEWKKQNAQAALVWLQQKKKMIKEFKDENKI